MSSSVLPMFSSKGFIVSGLIFRSLIHFVVSFIALSLEKMLDRISVLLNLLRFDLCPNLCLLSPAISD